MFSASVNSGIRFFVKQYFKVMSARYLVHQIHKKQVMVNGKIYFFKHGSTLKLTRCNFVVASLERYAQFPRFRFKVIHESINAVGNGTEVVVLKLLAFCRRVAKYCSAGNHHIRACIKERNVNQKIFLFYTERGVYARNIFIKILTDI